MIEINFDDRQLRKAIARLEKLDGALKPALQEMGEVLIDSTKQRFVTGTAPDGSDWAPNKPSTLSRKSGSKPLIGETHRLSDEIHYQIDAGRLLIGSVLKYSAVQQFGAAKGEFGKDRRGRPIPWGRIPARPFLGISDTDKQHLLEIIQEHVEDSLK